MNHWGSVFLLWILLICVIKQLFSSSVMPLFHDSGAFQKPFVYANYSGDVLLAGLFPIHVKGPGKGKCGPLNVQDGFQVIEAMMFALDQINNRTDFLHFRLGAFGIDTCEDPDYALSQVLSFVQVLLNRIDDNPLVCSDGSNPHPREDMNHYANIVGVLGGATSDVSLIIANFLKLFQIPQISYYATSPALSDKVKFPYFLRTVPPDNYAVRAIIDLMRKFEWYQVALIYDTTRYGLDTWIAFGEVLKEQHDLNIRPPICINEKKMRVSHKPNDFSETNEVIHFLNALDASITVVIFLVSQSSGIKLFTSIRMKGKESLLSRTTWVGIDPWSRRQMMAENNHLILRQSITIIPEVKKLKGFEEYLRQQKPSKTDRNPWLRQVYEQSCNCTYLRYLSKESRTFFLNKRDVPCEAIEEECGVSLFKDYEQMVYVPFVTKAVYAFAYAFKRVQDTKCAGFKGCKLSPVNITGVELMKELEKVNFNDNFGEEFEFMNGIDGIPIYSILYYPNSSSPDAEIGGTYDFRKRSNPLQLKEEFKEFSINFPVSVCSDPCGIGFAKRTLGSPCCWLCENCTSQEIVKPETRIWLFDRNALEDVTKCVACPIGEKPNSNKSFCEAIPEVPVDYSEGIPFAVILLSSIGICITFGVLLVMILYRSTPLIKASGRETSGVLLLGIFLSYFFPLIMISRPTKVICGINYIAPGFCSTICYAAIIAKTNRVARIFSLVDKPTLKKIRFISPISQIYIMSVMILAEFSILVILLGIMNPHTQKFIDGGKNQPVCEEKGYITIITGLMFPMVLLLLSTAYAFKIRKAPEGFNETRNITFVNYANCVVYIGCLALLYALKDSLHRSLAMCMFLVACGTADIIGLFVPKLYIILFRPEKNTKETVMSTKVRTLSTSSQMVSSAVHNPIVRPNSSSLDSNGSVVTMSKITEEIQLTDVDSPLPEFPSNSSMPRQNSTKSGNNGRNSSSSLRPCFKSQKSVSFGDVHTRDAPIPVSIERLPDDSQMTSPRDQNEKTERNNNNEAIETAPAFDLSGSFGKYNHHDYLM